MTERTTYEQNIAFIEQAVQRLERGEVSIDDLEGLSREFAVARQFCQGRLSQIESVVKATLAVGEGLGDERS